MGTIERLSMVLTLYLGVVCALPIADTRVNVNFTLPRYIPAPTFVTNRSREETFQHVAEIMKVAQKSPFRYGKRSMPVNNEINKRSGDCDYPQVKMYSARGFPSLNDITRRSLYPNGYEDYYAVEKSRRNNLQPIPGFNNESLEKLMDLYMYKEQLDRTGSKSPQKADLDQLINVIEFMENRRTKVPVKEMRNSYLNTKFIRARPGKRSALLQEQHKQTEDINGPVVFSSPMGEKPSDASNEKLMWGTVARKKTVAFGKGGFRRGNRSTTVGYN